VGFFGSKRGGGPYKNGKDVTMIRGGARKGGLRLEIYAQTNMPLKERGEREMQTTERREVQARETKSYKPLVSGEREEGRNYKKRGRPET